jgi:adenylate kinase
LGPSIALTGTPGTGKSAVAAELARGSRALEVGDLALSTGSGRRRGDATEVDLPRLSRRFSEMRARARPEFVVGHLAQLLPIRDVVVLRCHPIRLVARLDRARRGSNRDRIENAVAEATDLILREAIDRRRRILEIDTTQRSPATVAARILRWSRGARRPEYGSVDWLADPSVTDYLLARSP